MKWLTKCTPLNTENIVFMGNAILVQNPMSRVLIRFPTNPTLNVDDFSNILANKFGYVVCV